MSVVVLVTGSLFRAVEQRSSTAGKRYCVATLKSTSDGEGGDFWSILAFSETVQVELARLAVGEQLSVQGKCKVELYSRDGGNPRISRTVFADHVLALRAAPRERKPKVSVASETGAGSSQSSTFDDDIPF